MLWLCIALPRLPVEALALTEPAPLAVTRLVARRRLVVSCNDAAAALGIETGQDYATVKTIHPQLLHLERKSRAERSALERLAQWAMQWSGTIALHAADPDDPCDHAKLWLEIGASLKLFGGFGTLLARIEDQSPALGCTFRLGAAPTPEGAALLARASPRAFADSVPALRARVHEASVSFLALPPGMAEALWRAGIRTIGRLLELPPEAIARRFGPEAGRYLERLLALAPDPRPLYEPPRRYEAYCEPGFEIGSAEALLFPLRRMLFELQGYLYGVDAAVQRVEIAFEHRRLAATGMTLGVSAPSRDASALFALVRERFHRLALPAPVTGIRLKVEQLAAPAARQRDFFADRGQGAEELGQLLDRLAARLGPEAVQGLRRVADHRPELAWRPAPPGSAGRETTPLPARPLWLLPAPRRIEAPGTLLGGPERLESGWWAAPQVRRDYYLARDRDGTCGWVFQDHADRRWYLHGIWS